MSNKTNIDKFATKLNDMLNTYIAKNADYGDSFNDTLDEEGIIAARVRLSDKFSRFKQLSKVDKAKVNDESITDTLLDMANYAIMTALWLENKPIQKKMEDDEKMHKHMKKFNQLPKDGIAPPWRVTCSSGIPDKYEGFPDGITNQALMEKAKEIVSGISKKPKTVIYNEPAEIRTFTKEDAIYMEDEIKRVLQENTDIVQDYVDRLFLATDKKHDIADDIDAEQRYLESLRTAEFRCREYNIDTE